MPEGFEFYEKQLKEFNKNYVKNNYIKNIDTNNKTNKNGNNNILFRKLNQLNNIKVIYFLLKKKKIKMKKKKVKIKLIRHINIWIVIFLISGKMLQT